MEEERDNVNGIKIFFLKLGVNSTRPGLAFDLM